MTTQPQPEALAAVIALLRRDRQALADSERSYGAEPFSAEARDWLSEYDDAIKAVEALHSECEALRMERDALRAAARHGGWAGYIDSDALRADAERYRWLRSNSYIELHCDSPRDPGWTPGFLDQAIDAARAAKEQSNDERR